MSMSGEWFLSLIACYCRSDREGISHYRRAQRRLRSRRPSTQIVQEHAAAHLQLAKLADAVDVASYRPKPPDEGLVEAARGWVRGLRRRAAGG